MQKNSNPTDKVKDLFQTNSCLDGSQGIHFILKCLQNNHLFLDWSNTVYPFVSVFTSAPAVKIALGPVLQSREHLIPVLLSPS